MIQGFTLRQSANCLEPDTTQLPLLKNNPFILNDIKREYSTLNYSVVDANQHDLIEMKLPQSRLKKTELPVVKQVKEDCTVLQESGVVRQSTMKVSDNPFVKQQQKDVSQTRSSLVSELVKSVRINVETLRSDKM